MTVLPSKARYSAILDGVCPFDESANDPDVVQAKIGEMALMMLDALGEPPAENPFEPSES